MHLEIRKRGRKKKYFLAHSFRDNGKVRKVRRYLGMNLKPDEIEKTRPRAENAIREQIEIYRSVRDPLHTVLTSKERKIIGKLVYKSGIRVRHLSEKEWKSFIETFTYNTNAIEGSTVTAREVKEILEKNQWPKERTKEEISETFGVSDAIEHIRKTSIHISSILIKKLHKIVFKNSKEFAGKCRGRGIEVVVADQHGNVMHRGAPQRQIASLIKELVHWYEKNKRKYHPIVLAAVVHNQFENIHPFQDGNGRVGRLLLNNILIKHGYPPVNIDLRNRRKYYSTLQSYQNKGNIRPTIELILKEYRKHSHR